MVLRLGMPLGFTCTKLYLSIANLMLSGKLYARLLNSRLILNLVLSLFEGNRSDDKSN